MVNRIFFAVVGLIFIIFVYNQVKKKKLSEKESIFWMAGAVIILVLGIIPQIISILSNILHIEYPPALLFLIGIIFSLGLIFRLTIYISTLKEQVKELAQRNAIIEKRLDELQEYTGSNI